MRPRPADAMPSGSAILVVEDDPRMARLLHQVLTQQGHEILRAHDGAEAIDIVDRERPDLVLMDIGLPGIDGLQACKRIREFSAVPIIFLTGRSSEQDMVDGLSQGGDDYIAKPFSPREVIARVNAVLRRTRVVEPSRPPYDDGFLRVDFETRQVTRAGASVRLTRLEGRLFWMLVENGGRVMPHDAISRRVWGDGYGATGEQIRSLVRTVRQKIERDHGAPTYLTSQAGVGYSFVDPRSVDRASTRSG
ncbi:MAG: response regulator transcription factor [Chloroflexota bacterium]|nr:MAG: response regulator transcription factor [Chloroflexota bacterium]